MLKLDRYIIGLLSILLLASCEVVREDERLLPLVVTNDTTGRAQVLLEFTGFRCMNCPKAAAVADTLHQIYGDRLIEVSMHPASNPFTQGAAQYNYTCPDADTYYRYLGGNATTAFPTGNINLTTRGGSSLNDYHEWAAWLVQQMSEPTTVHIEARATYDADARKVTVNTSWYTTDPGYYNLVTWLVEDSVLGIQAMPDNSVNTSYYHRHVLRQAVGDVWGETIHANLFLDDNTVVFTLPEAYNSKHCSIVVAVLNEAKKIINARQTTIQ